MGKYIVSTFLIFILLDSVSAQKQHADVIIHSVNIIDVVHGKTILNKAVIINGKRIIAVVDEKQFSSWSSVNTINAKGKFIMPGLWDMHMHFGGGDSLIEENKNLLMLYLANGITSIRDCAADISPSVLEWRKEINEGALQGPTIYTAGPKLEGYKSIWVGDIEVDNSAELKKAIDSLQKIKVDFVKITDEASPVPGGIK
jgi:imidazolonepropionase-like amidohydrolase